MTTGPITSISDVIGDQIRALRKREGLTREELAAAARVAGAPPSLTATALGNIETGRRDPAGRRRRDVTVDELVWLASASGRAPVALLGEHAPALGGTSPADCPRCAGLRGQLEQIVRADVAGQGELVGIEPSLAETAYTLAAAIDAAGREDLQKAVPALVKELRATLGALTAAVTARQEPDDVDEDDALDVPE